MAIFTTQWLKSLFNSKTNIDLGKCKDDECNRLLQVILDGEASENDEKNFFQHIKNCSYCYNRYMLEKSIRKLIRTKMKKESVPADLVDSIKLKIQATQG
jgi:anti-sigma factor (TIGR02949 family)